MIFGTGPGVGGAGNGGERSLFDVVGLKDRRFVISYLGCSSLGSVVRKIEFDAVTTITDGCSHGNIVPCDYDVFCSKTIVVLVFVFDVILVSWYQSSPVRSRSCSNIDISLLI